VYLFNLVALSSDCASTFEMSRNCLVQRLVIFCWQPASTNGIPSAVKYLYSLHIKRATGQTVSSEMVHSDVNFSIRSRREI
jgi:hypothetical protein